MPILKSAIKKLRHDRKKEKENDSFRNSMERAVKTAKKIKSEKAVSNAFSFIDKAVKKKLIHKNKAKRMKSSLSSALPQKKTTAKEPSKEAPAAKAPRKNAAKTKKSS